MKKVLLILISITLSCGDKVTELSLSIAPKQPVLIPKGETSFLGETIQAPFFFVSSITMTWKNVTDPVTILAIEIKQVTGSYSCIISGDDLKVIFSLAENNCGGNVCIKAATSASSPKQMTSQQPYPCSGVPLNNKDADVFNIPMKVKVYAFQGTGSTASGRVTVTEVITVR